MASVAVSGEVMVGRISPALVSIENSLWSVQPALCRYRAACLAPLPESSASDPSGLKIRSSATWRGSSA